MTDNDIVRRGYMNVVHNPQGGVLGRVLSVTSRRNWVVLRRESGGGSNRIELYRNEEQSGEPLKVFALSPQAIRNIETLERKKAFVLIMQDDSWMFQCSSRADVEDWYRDIQYYSSSGNRTSAPPTTGEIYEVIPDDETFHVRLRKAKTLAFSGSCLLEILRDFERNLFHIGIFSEEELPRLVVKWQIDHIRQYGSNNMAFKFESGSKSSTGVDWFIVDTDPGCAVRIHKSVDYWAKHIVEQLKNIPGNVPRRSTLPSTPNVPDNSCTTSSSHATSQSQSNNTYMTINQDARAPASVYADPGKSKVKPGGGSRSNKPPPSPQPTSLPANPTYMSLDQRSMDSTQNQTYEGIAPRVEGIAPRVVRQNQGSANGGDSTNPTTIYMGIDPHTRNTVERQYMALGSKDKRSK